MYFFYFAVSRKLKKFIPFFSNTLKEWNLVLTQQKKSFFVYMMEVKNISCYCPFKERREKERQVAGGRGRKGVRE